MWNPQLRGAALLNAFQDGVRRRGRDTCREESSSSESLIDMDMSDQGRWNLSGNGGLEPKTSRPEVRWSNDHVAQDFR